MAQVPVNYDEYLQSNYWKQRRFAALERADFKCMLCGETENLNVHHLSYEHLGNESPDELLVICGGHHWIEHFVPKISQPDKPKSSYCTHVSRWHRQIKAIIEQPHLIKKDKQRLKELERRLQSHLKRCPICKTTTTFYAQ